MRKSQTLDFRGFERQIDGIVNESWGTIPRQIHEWKTHAH
jgi:hypothetical protein